MVFNVFKSFISNTAAEPRTAGSPAYGCVLYNEAYICSGSQYHMYCNTRMHHFYYQRDQDQHQYHCMSNDCICVGNNDSCACYNDTKSCFCETFSNNITVPTAVSPVYDCVLYNDTYICTGAQYHMYCNTSVHDFHYYRYHYHCVDDNCNCIGDGDTCTCYSNTSSSCFCTNSSNSITIPAAVSPVYDCVLYNDTYICTGVQYRMYCNTRMHNFYYWRYQNQNQYQYQCWSNNCDCIGNKDNCTCYSSTLSSCFCEAYSNSIALTTAVSPVTDPDCVLHNQMFICTGAQYRMYCDTRMHDFSYQRYHYQYQYQCVNNNCDCTGTKDTCTCSSSTLSSCFCKTYGNIIALTTAVSPVYDCVLYNDASYICTGAQYHMYCNASLHYFYYSRYHYHCLDDNCNCIGDGDTCTCYSNTSSSCYCTNSSNIINIPAAVSPVYDCGLYNDTYICTGAQYRMYCNTKMHYFFYRRYRNQNQYEYEYECWSNNCYCVGNKDTCTCYSSTLSSCFCETYGDIIALTTAVSPVYDCVLYNDTYICTGAQYHMYCNTSLHYFHYSRHHYHCVDNNCNCIGDGDTCTCYSNISSSCFCTNDSSSITIPAAVSPVYDCVLYNDTYICTGAQYRMYCNIKNHYFFYWRYRNQNQYEYECWSNNCNCIGNKDTCTCYSSTLSSCFCESNIFTPTTAGLITLPDQCMSQTSGGCSQDLLEQVENITAQVLPLDTVMNILTVVFNASEKILETSSANPTELASYGNRMLKTSEKLISTLVKPTVTSDSVGFTLPAVEGQVFMVGPLVTLDKTPRLETKSSSVDIDLIGIAKNNNERAAVAFMSYNTMENLLKPDFFNTSKDTIKTMMSTVISATLPKTTNTTLTKPVNFTFRHIREFDSSGSLSCVYWNISEWIVDGCSVLKTNSSYTVCSCVHLSTFALIQISSRPPKMDLVILVSVTVVLAFFSLALLTFALCRWSPVRDWIHGCIVHGPEGYNREELRCSTRSASDVFAVDSKPTSKVSQKTQTTTTSF
ncbi:uncharacterized protein LOC131550609 [Onychostoma macrolepis]|uniref:GAIN-B domain-containing protein n=1 Tax=Onychostoma macrolepis TaxID=369639 RepID=A0A7J6DFR1_9TELE|nr:uncharacterized protein LOC131550609 [Onychostoma macrolepis]KAF4118166.1 hypothetical protein G5714_000217 [Onychostoma macrolepis]